MNRKRFARYLILFFPVVLGILFLHPVTGSPEDGGIYMALPGRFFLVDADENRIPDHLGFSVWVNGEYAGDKFWLCGELQAMVGRKWQTVAYTAKEFSWPGEPVEAVIYFYGGEIKRLKQNGPFRLQLQLKGVNVEQQEFAGFSPSYQYRSFERSDLVLTGGKAVRTSEVVAGVEQWAKRNGMVLGDLEEITFSFDRWRLDFAGTRREPPRRVWVESGGEISWVEKIR